MTPHKTTIDMKPARRRVLSMEDAFRVQRYKPHSIQRKFHGAKRVTGQDAEGKLQYTGGRFRTTNAGRRTGKSNMGGHELAFEAMRMPGRLRVEDLTRYGRRAEFWIVGPEYSDAEKEFRVLYDTLKKMNAEFDMPGTYYSPAGGQLSLSMFEGAFQVHTKSAKKPDTLVGEALEGVIFAEAAKVKPVVWPKFIRPMLADYRGWAAFTSTPEGKNWFYDLWKLGQDPNNDEYWSIRAPSWSNNILFPGGRYDPEIISLGAGMSDEKFNQEIGADFTEFVGRVYKQFDEETNVTDCLYDPRLPLYIAADYGYTNPNVLLFIQVGVWGDVYVIAEYYKRQRDAQDMAREVLADPRLGPLSRAATLLYPDPEDPGATATLADMLHLKPQGNTGGLLNTRIELIRKALKPQPFELPDGHPEKLPKLWIDRSCANTIKDMLDYRYPETKDEASTVESKENPLKADDHGPEALSRFFGGYFHEQKPKRRARQSTASWQAA
ncbi:terminase [Microbacterium phage RikSengupta]|nr:terminase [Microbacterium phage RikSengupta]